MKITYRIAFLMITIGLITIFTGEKLYKRPKISPKSIGKDDIGKKIVTSGRIKQIKYTGNTTFINLHQNSDLVIVKFTRLDELQKGDKIQISGEIDSYHGKVEILADRIKKR